MTSYPQHRDCIVCGEPKAHYGYHSREDGRPVYVCEHCGAYFKLKKSKAYVTEKNLPQLAKGLQF